MWQCCGFITGHAVVEIAEKGERNNTAQAKAHNKSYRRNKSANIQKAIALHIEQRQVAGSNPG